MKEIYLANGKGIALVNNEDYEMLSKYKWQNNQMGKGYAITSIKINNKYSNKYMHQFLIDVSDGYEIDHIDNNGLNNQRDNLRVVTHRQNMMNKVKYKNSTSIYKGVCWHKQNKKWQASIRLDKKLHYLGYFIDEKDAAIAYNIKAKELFKEYAYLNEV